MKKMKAEEVAELAQFVQVVRKTAEEMFGNRHGLKLLELDLGISGNKNVVILPGAERYFLQGSVTNLLTRQVIDFRTDFAMSLGDTHPDDVAPMVSDMVDAAAARFGQ